MPHIAVTMYPGRNEEVKRGLAEAVAECVATTLKVDSKYITVTIDEVAPESWQNHIDAFNKDSFFVRQ